MTANGKNRSDDFVRLAEFVKKNLNDFGKWGKEDHYAVFRKRRLKYSYPTPDHPVFRISTYLDDSEWEYLGKFSFAKEQQTLQSLYKKSPEELFVTEKFKDFVYIEFDYKRMLNILEMLAEISDGPPLGVQMDKDNNELIIKPVTDGEKYDYVMKNEQELQSGLDKIMTSYLITYPEFRDYVLVKVKDVLQNDELFRKYSEKLGFALTHIFFAETKALMDQDKSVDDRYGEEHCNPLCLSSVIGIRATIIAMQIAERHTELEYAPYWYSLLLPNEVEASLVFIHHVRPVLEALYPIKNKAIKDNPGVYLVS